MEEKAKKTNKKLTMLIVTLILAALCVFGYFTCQKFKNNATKQKFFNAIDKLFTEIAKENKQEAIKTFNGDYTISMDISSEFIDEEIQDIINKLKINFKLTGDIDNNNYNLNLNTTYDNDNLLKAKLSVLNNNLFVFLDDVYSKWIKIDSTTNINTNNLLTNNDYKVLKDEFEKAINRALKNKYFTKDIENDLNKYTLTIDKDNIKDIIDDILYSLENSKDFIKIFEKVSNTKFSKLSKEIKSETKSYKSMNPILISVYTDNNDNLKQISLETSENDATIKLVMELVDNHNIKLTVYNNDLAMLNGSIEQLDEQDKKIFNIKLSMMGMFTANLKLEGTTKYNEKVAFPTITDSVETNDLTEDDIQNIYMRLLNNKGLIKIIETIQNYTNQKEEM